MDEANVDAATRAFGAMLRLVFDFEVATREQVSTGFKSIMIRKRCCEGRAGVGVSKMACDGASEENVSGAGPLLDRQI